MTTANSACVIVMGDLGRSPRMVNHALSIVNSLANYSVDLIGFRGSELPEAVRTDPRIRVRYISTAVQDKLRNLPRILYPIYALIRIWIETMILLYLLLCKNPPSIPSLAVCILVKWVRRTRLIMDWHNYGFTILQINRRNNFFVKLMKFYETRLGRFANGHLCVSQAMQRDLLNRFNIPYRLLNRDNRAHVLYDKANQRFRLLSLEERHEFYKRFFGSVTEGSEQTEFTVKSDTPDENGKIRYRENRPLIIVSSSSYTPDEDFGILVKALTIIDRALVQRPALPQLIFVLTGRGPLRDQFAATFAATRYSKVRVLMRWLEPDDYPRLLGAADLGICFHYSSSGLDLPMKVVDMFATQLPVLAVGYRRYDDGQTIHG